MKIVVTTKKPVISPDGRRLARDIPIDVADLYGRFLVAEGLALPLEVKEAQDRPTGGAGEGTQSSVPPVAQVFAKQTLPALPTGKKRGRPARSS